MSERVAIVGSRTGADLDAVEDFVRDMHSRYPETILVSGGARGVDMMAERTWLGLGGRVESYRPVKKGDSWAIERWRLGGGQPSVTVLKEEPTWEDFKSAALYRDMLIAEKCDRLVSFYRYGRSPGAAFTASQARDYGKDVYEYEVRRG